MERKAEEEFDVPEEPSVTSDDPEERKLARRLRIQRRREAQRKQKGIEEVGSIEKTPTEKQIETSAESLEKIIAEGEEVVSNVKIANEARALDRRQEDIEIRNRLLKKLEEEAEESLGKYKAISERWSSMLASKDPLDIHNDIQSQNEKCHEILREKDLLIAELKAELKSADEKFVSDQKKQSEDINLLIERIENQVDTIAKAYRKELSSIDEALNAERSSLLESVAKKWDALYRKRYEEEANGVEKRKEIMREYETEMKRVIIEHQEKFRAEKIELETECQNLEQEVQRMKAICTMNLEKLNYSYAVLKHREDENIIIKAQQKRRINKLQDVINGLKKTYNELEEKTRLEIQKLSEQVTKAHKNIIELEAKSEHFTRTNEKQLFDIWDMNTQKANELVDKILTADRILHQQILGLDWEPPEFQFLKREDLPSYRRAMDEIEQKKAEVDESMKILEVHDEPTNLEDSNTERRLLNNILRQISDQTGFLIDDRLRELLAPHTTHENIIIRLDNVFHALEIKSQDQVDVLRNFFLPYAYCPTCVNEEEESSTGSDDQKEESSCEENAESDYRSEGSKISRGWDDREKGQGIKVDGISEAQGSEESDSKENSERGSIDESRKQESVVTRSSENFGSSVARNRTCAKGHSLEIQTSNVTRALREFAEKYRSNDLQRISNRRKKITGQKVTSLSRALTNEDITNYWKQYNDIFPADKEKLWDGLLIGLRKYHDVLKERHRLNNETESLRKQNEELKRLLETYVPGNNSSIEIGSRHLSKTA